MALLAPPVTGFSGFWQYHAPAGQTAPYAPRFYRSSEEYRASVQINKRGFRKYKAQMRALNGVAPGASAVDTFGRVTAVQAINDGQSNGGRRTIGTVSNTTTTTAPMASVINARLYDQLNVVQPYPIDASGNGGGGKRGR